MHTVLNTWVFICLLEKAGDMEMRRYSLLLEEILHGDVPSSCVSIPGVGLPNVSLGR